MVEQALAPRRGTFVAWWEVTTLPPSGEAQTHRQDGNFRGVIKRVAVNTHPLPQTVAARIIEWHTAHVSLIARGLSGDQYSSARVRLKDRTGPQGQMGCAKIASSNLCGERS